MYTVFDIEANGLLDNVTKIHCLSYTIVSDSGEFISNSITNYQEIRDFILKQENLVGHNILLYDIPVLNKILDIDIKANLIDTLSLSWYLYPLRKRHGLEVWGEELGVEKPIILDWDNLKIEEYINRCATDVIINTKLFFKQLNYLNTIYDNNAQQVQNLIKYLSFKLSCIREQEEQKCKIDRNLVTKSLEELKILRDEKIQALSIVMPKEIKYKEVKKPSKMFKADGSYSVAGQNWFNFLEKLRLPQDFEENIMMVDSEKLGNPASTIQLKNWLFSLGWQPLEYKFLKNTQGGVNEVPQIYVNNEVCDSIKRLYEIEPALQNLDMLSLIEHRIGIFESFLSEMNSEDFVIAGVRGFTNTLRFKHKKPIVNLPKVFKFYGEQIRGAIIKPGEEYILCGSDMSSLEDTTKQHYMYFFDPEYVKQMRVPGFDPHLDIAVLANLLTPEQVEQHKNKEVDHSQVRNLAKTVNFAGVYGAGPPKIAQTTGMSLEQAQKLHKTYWERNKSVKQVANSCITKTTKVEGETQMWLFNPVSRFWYSLRFEKDKFSTLNQGKIGALKFA